MCFTRPSNGWSSHGDRAKGRLCTIKLAVPRSISHHWRDDARDLDWSLENKGNLCRENGITEFASPAHFVRIAGGGLRMVVDFQRLNEAVERPILLYSRLRLNASESSHHTATSYARAKDIARLFLCY